MKSFVQSLGVCVVVSALFGSMLIACAHMPQVSGLKWLAGCWQSMNQAPGSGEQWALQEADVLHGISRYVKDGKVVVGESMQIRAQKNGRLAFFAQPAGQQPAIFPLLRMNETEVVFENLGHDFPQRIIYRLENGENLNASIKGMRNGKQRTIAFPMQRIHCSGQ